jgi:hypothetical protein
METAIAAKAKTKLRPLDDRVVVERASSGEGSSSRQAALDHRGGRGRRGPDHDGRE